MAYIGAEPVPGQNREVDDISSGFNGSATAFTLQVSSVNVSPESANNILINLGGVLQNPGTDYTIAASTLTFTTAPAAGLSFFGLILGAGINTATVADDTIGASKLIDTAVTAGSYTTADITVDAQGRITAAASGTISGAEIADQAVTNAKVNNSAAIAASKIADFVTGNTNNRILTATGTANSLNGEANLTFDGANLLLNSAGGNVLFGETTAYNTFENSSTNPKLQVRGTDLNGSCQAWIRATGDGGAPKLFLANTRNTSSNGHTIVQNGDELGGLFFSGSDGSQFVNGASISAVVSGTPAADDVPGALVFGTNAGAAATTESMRIDSSGNLAIGTSVTNEKVHIHTASSLKAQMQFTNTTTGTAAGDGLVFGITGAEHAIMWNQENTNLQFATNNTERMRVTNSGDVLIGVTTTGSTSAGMTIRPGNESTLFRDTGIVMLMGGGQSGQKIIDFRQGGTSIGSIQKSGTTNIQYNTSSDYRLKENAVDISDGITRLKTLKPYRFNYKVEPDKTVDGFFAHEVTAVPEAISGTKDEVDSDNNPVYQGIDHSKLVPLLTAALQESVSKIETLETKVAALEAS